MNANTPQTIDPIGVTMNVTPPKDWGKLAGTVTGTDDGSGMAIQPGVRAFARTVLVL